jgi:hypothetical protein
VQGISSELQHHTSHIPAERDEQKHAGLLIWILACIPIFWPMSMFMVKAKACPCIITESNLTASFTIYIRI